jgi:hypothetical protein
LRFEVNTTVKNPEDLLVAYLDLSLLWFFDSQYPKQHKSHFFTFQATHLILLKAMQTTEKHNNIPS